MNISEDLMPIATTLIVYILVIYLIGYWASLRTQNLKDYVLGGRTLSGSVTALAAGASDMSSWLLLALPGAFYINGLQAIWLPIGLSIGAYLNWKFLAKRLRIYSEILQDALTIPAYLEARFCDQTRILKLAIATVILIFFTVYASAGFISAARLMQTTFGLSYHTALIFSSSLIVLYTCLGGFLAISWIDFFQGSLMFFVLLMVPLYTLAHLGGWDATVISLSNLGQDFLDPYASITWAECVTYLAWGLGYFGQLHILVRFMAIKQPNKIPLARRICMSWMILVLMGAIGTGLFGRVYFQSKPLADPETTFIVLSQVLFNPWITGIALSAFLSALMSTISAQLVACSSVLAEDFYRAFWRKQASNREYLLVARLSVLFISIIAIVMALDPNNTIMQVVEYAWSGMGAAFGPLILSSLYWSRMTRNAAVAGVIVGAMTVMIWEPLRAYGGIFELGSLLPGFLFNSITIMVVSLLDRPPRGRVPKQFRTFQQKLLELESP